MKTLKGCEKKADWLGLQDPASDTVALRLPICPTFGTGEASNLDANPCRQKAPRKPAPSSQDQERGSLERQETFRQKLLYSSQTPQCLENTVAPFSPCQQMPTGEPDFHHHGAVAKHLDAPSPLL